MTSIEVRDLCARYAGGFRLGPVSFDLAAGARAAILGPSGCGKSSLLRCLAGLEQPTAGTIQFGDRVVFDGHRSTPPHERRIGFVFQDAALWPHLTAVDHLRFVDPALSVADATALLAQVGLEALAQRRPGTLSGGEGQRLALARALAGAPEVLLLDEPSSSIDVPLRDELSLLVHRLCESSGITLLVVTHDRHEALATGDELFVMRGGRVVEAGATATILRSPATAFGAEFVCGATCLPATPRGDATVDTPFGRFERSVPGDRAVALVLLPGDVELAPNGSGAASGQVIRVTPASIGWIATVALGAAALRIACDDSPRVGATVGLRMRVAARILPVEETT